ncbi:MAG: hypothetical protein OEQ13_07870, partial [Acidobacteriota bacterium]|nr:hypothetical protein [Acidobacteriota bacterium]
TDSAWGVGTTVANIEVYASSSGPAFTTDMSTLLTNPALSGTATEYTHDLEPSDPPNWYYLVTAIDSAGERSASGVELPAPIEDLLVDKSGGNLVFTWSAISTTMDSPPDGPRSLKIVGYNLYGRNSVLARTDAGSANVIQQGISGTSVSIPTPPDAFFTYQLVAEDSHGSESVY